MSFFLQRRVQPLQHRVFKLWSYSGLKDPSRVSEEDINKKDIDKQVRSLTTLTKDHDILELADDFFDSERPLPSVHAVSLTDFIRLVLLTLQGHQFLVSCPPLLEEGPIQADPISATSEAPEAEESQDGDDAEDSLEGTSSTTSPPPTHSEDPSFDRKRERVEEFISSSTSASKAAVREPSAPHEDEELFDLLDSYIFADS
jgi:hypothetical protein